MMLEIAIGDAYGAGFEFADESLIKERNTLLEFISHQKWNTIPGTYTDDTQMSIAVAELMLEDLEWTPQVIAQKFLEVFRRDPRKGYSAGFYDILSNPEVKKGEDLLKWVHGKSNRNGAAMRSGPLGFFPKSDQVMEYAEKHVKITHNSPEGIASAQAVALATYYFIHGLGEKKDVIHFLNPYISRDWHIPWEGKVGVEGSQAVRAALTAVLQHSSLSEILKQSIAYQGDVDTVAAIAMAIASECREIKKDIPNNLIQNLEDGKYGRDYLISLDQKLKQKFLGE